MKKTYLALAVAAALSAASGVVQAQDYNVEIGASYIDFDGDDHALKLDATFHFETVNTAGRPLAEAAFMGRNNNVSAFYATRDDADIDRFAIGGEFWLDDIYLSATYMDESGDNSDDESSYELRVGYMVGDDFLVSLGYEDGDERDDETISLAAKYVGQIGDNFINVEGGIASTDGDNLFSLAGDYYFTREFSAGLRLAESDVSGVKTRYGIAARYFVTPTISGEIEYLTQDSVDEFTLRVAARF
ncbi:putative porin [Alcanivorax sp. JB21]|uniref:putative porin n=1 Tax=Alcanivorax limicola TaxID=2874102 RepID=UPI001CBACE3F|nr:putative porin [Alcanivorax limicola]MBZ2189848.1 putative porin [Alcanivorax limicola]